MNKVNERDGHRSGNLKRDRSAPPQCGKKDSAQQAAPRAAHLPRELHPAEQDGREVERDEAGRKEEECQPVLEAQTVDRTVHAAVRPAQREARRLHRGVDTVEHGDHLEAHPRRRHAEPAGCEEVGGLVGNVHLDDAVVGKAGEQRRLRADRPAVLRVEVELLLPDAQKADLQLRLESALVG
eukprot:313663-Prymnesium_polylepis.2